MTERIEAATIYSRTPGTPGEFRMSVAPSGHGVMKITLSRADEHGDHAKGEKILVGEIKLGGRFTATALFSVAIIALGIGVMIGRVIR